MPPPLRWSQRRLTPEGAVQDIVVDPARLLADLTPSTRGTLTSFIDEYRAFIIREWSWRRCWSRPERGIDVELEFLSHDMKAALAAWSSGETFYQMALLLAGYDPAAEAKLIARVRQPLAVNFNHALASATARPGVLVIARTDIPPTIRPVLQTDLLTLPAAFFALAAEADRVVRGLD